MASIKSTPRTKTAIRKADRLPRNLLPGSKARPNVQYPQTSEGGGTGAYPCKVTGAPTGGSYPVDVHKNGKTEPKTGTAEIQVLQLHISSIIPTGSWLMGFDTTLANYNDEE